MQIAEELGIKIQNVYYYVNKLVKAGIAERGIKTSYSEVYIKESLKIQLKEKISQFEEAKFVNLNCHHISVHWPIIQDSNYQFGKERIRWRSNLREKIIYYEKFAFRAQKTSKNLIIGFPSNIKIIFNSIQKENAIKNVDSYALQIAGEIKNKVLKEFKYALELGKPIVKAHYAFSDEFARKYTGIGITMLLKDGNKWVAIDKSPHFNPVGELETNDKDTAKNYLKLNLNKEKIERLNWVLNEGFDKIQTIISGSLHPFTAGSPYPSGTQLIF